MPLRTRLAITFVAFFAAALIALEVATYLFVRQTLINGIDNELRLGAELLQKDFTTSNKNLVTFFKDGQGFVVLAKPSVGNLERTNLYAQVYDLDGTEVAASPNLPSTLEANPAALDAALNGDTTALTVDNGSYSMREMLLPLVLRGQVVGVLHMARLISDANRALNVLLYALLGGGLLVLVAAARGGVWLTRAALRPIDQISETAQSIVHAEDLSRRVPVPEPADELQRLAVTINDLLARLEGLFSAQRRFVADVSHELRTPLAAMQGNLDVLSRGAARDPQLLAESLTDMRSEVNRMIRMVNDLLLLAQSDSGVKLRREPVELDTLLLEVHREMRPLAAGIQLRLGHEDQLTVVGDRDRIKQALLNLAVNAIQHTPQGGTVTLSLDQADGFARMSISDTGAGIDPADLPFIFDRFYRADQTRTRSSGGAGLGLAIVKWIAEAHGGNVTVTSELGQGSTFAFLLPMSTEGIPTVTLELPKEVPQLAGSTID